MTPVGGRLSNFVEGWKHITNDPYVLSIVAKGYRLRFTSPPLLRQTPWEIRSPQGPEEILGMREQITLMLQKNAFMTNSVLSSVRKGDYTFKIDLQDAYFHVPIHPSSRKFAFKNKVYQFQVLPFGLNTAPQVFNRLGHTVTGDHWGILSGDLGDTNVTISRRLANSPPGPPSSANKYARLCRLYPKQKETRAGPDSRSPVSRNLFTSGLRGSFPSRVQSLGDSCTRTPSILPPSINLFSSVPAYGVTQLGLRSYPSGSFVPETPSTSFSLVRPVIFNNMVYGFDF